MRLYQSHASFSYVVTILLFMRRYHMFYDVRQGQMLVQGVFTHHIDRRMTSRTTGSAFAASKARISSTKHNIPFDYSSHILILPIEHVVTTRR